MALDIPTKVEYSRESAHSHGIETNLLGGFNLENAAAAAALGSHFHIPDETIKKAILSVKNVPGRMEPVKTNALIHFTTIVDYAHTPDSLEAAYGAFPNNRKICVLGGTGGGRDTWKRPRMGEIAAKNCDAIFLTDEDPYDENPNGIVEAIAKGIVGKEYKIIMDRREAIREAVKVAKDGDVIFITGKGTDPYIMGANGSKIPWSDSEIAREEIEKIYGK